MYSATKPVAATLESDIKRTIMEFPVDLIYPGDTEPQYRPINGEDEVLPSYTAT